MQAAFSSDLQKNWSSPDGPAPPNSDTMATRHALHMHLARKPLSHLQEDLSAFYVSLSSMSTLHRANSTTERGKEVKDSHTATNNNQRAKSARYASQL